MTQPTLVLVKDITEQDIDKASAIKNDIRAFIASFPMSWAGHHSITLTHQFAIWHIKQVEALEQQIENMRNEITGKA